MSTSHHTTSAPNVELLSPAGDWDCLRAAVENGANAVYFGLDCGFNARARAQNFGLEELPSVVEFLHQRHVSGYVTLNTLAFSEELEEVEQVLRQIAGAGVDAVLVQDIGVARLARQICPALQLHASTQMTLTSAECIAMAHKLGITRVVLPRELSLEEIAAIHSGTDMELEAFVHGALCVAYSGQCLTSESLGGRSANRGQCAQACRLPYELICDGDDVELGEVQYLLSPQDLAAYELTPQLIAAGVSSFKIEGRLKSAEYVANITRHYRRAIDCALQGLAVDVSAEDRDEMELSFSRGFSPGWLQGCDHKMLVPGTSSAKRGLRIGTVQGVRRSLIAVQLDRPIAVGDGVAFWQGAGEANQGGRIYEIYREGERINRATHGTVELGFARDAIDVTRLVPGLTCWQTDAPALNRRLRESFTSADPLRRVALDLRVTCSVGDRLHVWGKSEAGHRCEVVSEHVLEAARTRPVTEDQLREQLGRLGGSVFALRGLKVEIMGEPMIPLSVLGALRREMVEQLLATVVTPPRQLASPGTLLKIRAGMREGTTILGTSAAASQSQSSVTSSSPPSQPTNLYLLCRSLDQLTAAAELGIRTLYVDFQDIGQYREAMEIGRQSNCEIWLATPRIQKPTEVGLFRVLAKHEGAGYLVRNFAGLRHFADQPCVADYSLNVANELSAEFLREQGAQRITPSYDMNRDQLMSLVRAVAPSWLEVVVHQQMPMFHMEHCVFCAVLSPGTNKTNCGRPCDVHQVELRDRVGMAHPLVADVGCRNTLFNAVPQSSAEVIPSLCEAGVRHFRVELLRQTPEETRATIKLYRGLFEGRVSGKEVWTELRAMNRVGVTRGTLEERRNPLAIL